MKLLKKIEKREMDCVVLESLISSWNTFEEDMVIGGLEIEQSLNDIFPIFALYDHLKHCIENNGSSLPYKSNE